MNVSTLGSVRCQNCGLCIVLIALCRPLWQGFIQFCSVGAVLKRLREKQARDELFIEALCDDEQPRKRNTGPRPGGSNAAGRTDYDDSTWARMLIDHAADLRNPRSLWARKLPTMSFNEFGAKAIPILWENITRECVSTSKGIMKVSAAGKKHVQSLALAYAYHEVALLRKMKTDDIRETLLVCLERQAKRIVASPETPSWVTRTLIMTSDTAGLIEFEEGQTIHLE